MTLRHIRMTKAFAPLLVPFLALLTLFRQRLSLKQRLVKIPMINDATSSLIRLAKLSAPIGAPSLAMLLLFSWAADDLRERAIVVVVILSAVVVSLVAYFAYCRCTSLETSQANAAAGSEGDVLPTSPYDTYRMRVLGSSDDGRVTFIAPVPVGCEDSGAVDPVGGSGGNA
ncbi:hypothetical protein OCUBac02_52120 (plasmid) [Bosea sp. ANAM02]|nr:hypothetical protein OCUBac02_52120 [Bosea sp. ANAM02]